MHELILAWKNLLARPVQTAITLLVVAIATALFVTLVHLSDGLRQGIIRASDPFGVLVIGAKGSGQQLVLSTLLLQGTPVGNIPGAIYAELAQDPLVRYAVPLAMGDNVGGARVIGVNENFFRLSSTETSPPSFQIDRGRLLEADFEVVLGSRAARTLGLGPGDSFIAAHGVEEGIEDEHHEDVYTVVGILKPSSTAFDAAALTTVHSVVEAHAEGDADEDAHAEVEAHDELSEIASGDITAILVKPVGYGEANELWRRFYTGTTAQAAFPGGELGALFDLLNQGQRLLQAVSILTGVLAVMTLFLAVYSAADNRERLIAAMRLVGAPRTTIFVVVVIEGVVIAFVGALLGRILGYGVSAVIASQITAQSAVPVTIRWLANAEVWFWLIPIVAGAVASIIPAIQAYRTDLIGKLAPA